MAIGVDQYLYGDMEIGKDVYLLDSYDLNDLRNYNFSNADLDLGVANEVLSLHGIAQSLGQRFERPP